MCTYSSGVYLLPAKKTSGARYAFGNNSSGLFALTQQIVGGPSRAAGRGPWGFSVGFVDAFDGDFEENSIIVLLYHGRIREDLLFFHF